ncbi:nucleotidyl transferase AbiEii/AbiGii toxin family protein [Pedobacter cryophilus]|uniref:Nucleotidyl transferase AbiEii/AbiGii toxin family protein n=1 Tax=Pedobacter cryophilus TaxID=2571271 RepID=A0A4U1C1S9_9SPHI|nr:nucleotidyl transferase AbiEii/AbiGii toxin family protein [Pedobacter cryophilus]TKB99035.1 nucleotidyl transferase AbiEii/AbiGii toxin family protein [Pedobacter cryophilus]
MLYWNTVEKLLKETLLTITQAEELKEFRLVGGTAMSLHLGHRISVDIDLFTDAYYGSIKFDEIDKFIKNNFEYVTGDFGGNPGMGKSYLVGKSPEEVVKLDVYYSMDPFFQNIVEEDGIRMASLEEIIAMKVDIIQRVGRKKDFWDLHEVLNEYDINKMVDLHRQRFEWTHDEKLIMENFLNFADADDDLTPICLRGKEWVFIKEDFEDAIEKSKAN